MRVPDPHTLMLRVAAGVLLLSVVATARPLRAQQPTQVHSEVQALADRLDTMQRQLDLTQRQLQETRDALAKMQQAMAPSGAASCTEPSQSDAASNRGEPNLRLPTGRMDVKRHFRDRELLHRSGVHLSPRYRPAVFVRRQEPPKR